MSRISVFAAFCTSSQISTFSALDGNSRLEVVKNFYKTKGLELPGTITVVSTRKGSYLSKDDKIKIQSEYIAALQAGEVPAELAENLKAVTDPDAVVTTTTIKSYANAVNEFGPAIVAAKLIDSLSVSDCEEFHKIRKFNVPAAVAISEIPAFIAELQKIYEAAQK